MTQPPPPDGDLRLSPGQTETLRRFAHLVRRWNKVAGLVSPGDLERFWERHVLDSLLAANAIPWLHQRAGAQRLRLADLGSGAGLPGVPVAVALPGASVTLVDRNVRKARFLNRVRHELGLRNVRVLCADFKAAFAHCSPGGYDAATARAVQAPLSLWASVSGLLKPGGHLLVLDRVARSDQDLQEALDSRADYPGCAVLTRRWIRMPELKAWHSLLVIAKAGASVSPHSG